MKSRCINTLFCQVCFIHYHRVAVSSSFPCSAVLTLMPLVERCGQCVYLHSEGDVIGAQPVMVGLIAGLPARTCHTPTLSLCQHPTTASIYPLDNPLSSLLPSPLPPHLLFLLPALDSLYPVGRPMVNHMFYCW